MGRVLLILVLAAVFGAAVYFFLQRGPAPPTAEIEALKQRAEDAIAASEARVYAPDAVRAVQDSVAAVERMLEAQMRRLPFQRDFEPLRRRFGNVDAAIDDMRRRATAGKQTLVGDVDTAIAELRDATAAVAAELRDMPVAKGSRPAVAAFRNDLETIQQRIPEIQKARDGGRLHQAGQQARAAKEQANALLQEIRDTKARVRALREGDGF